MTLSISGLGAGTLQRSKNRPAKEEAKEGSGLVELLYVQGMVSR